ncbi:Rha family transcriptional regulator, partial [Bacteroides stercoris]|uniref:Rha family transcriptional regulator n=1 Tax=Bacteroides stercoris TaxID=46506 RepID=UPI00233EEB39
MNNLILSKSTMSSLEIAELTGKRHDAILRDIRNLLSQGVNAHNFVEVEYLDKKGEARPSFNLTKKGCLILASGYDAKLREKIIDRWEQLETAKRNGAFQAPQNYLEALEALVISEKEKQYLRADNKNKEVQISNLTPKAEFADCFLSCKGDITIGELANILNQSCLFSKGR